MKPLLDITDVSLSYHDLTGETPALSHISFQLMPGEFLAIVGPSGCGKSTLLNLICGLIQPEQGQILLDGIPVTSGDRRIGYMLQKDHLLEWRTIYKNVLLGLEIRGELTTEKLSYVDQILSDYGLDKFRLARPSQLSGGMRQRAAFLRTLLCHADILLLDEPFGALDVITRGEMQDWLLSVRKQMNRTVLLVTHDMDEAIYLSDRILVLDAKKGKVRQEFTVKEEKRNREWLYEQGALRREIYKEIMEGKVNV